MSNAVVYCVKETTCHWNERLPPTPNMFVETGLMVTQCYRNLTFIPATATYFYANNELSYEM